MISVSGLSALIQCTNTYKHTWVRLLLTGPVYSVLLKIASERTCLVLGAALCSAPLIGAAYIHDILSLCVLVGFVHGKT